MLLPASRRRPIVATEPAIVVTTPPVVDRMGLVFPLFPESAELPFRSQQTGTGPNGALRHSPASPRLPAPLFLASSALSSHLRSSTCCSFVRPLSSRVHQASSHDAAVLMSRAATPLQRASTMSDSSTHPSPRCPIPPMETLHVRLHSPCARLPMRGSDRAAGYDLYSAEVRTIPSRGQAAIDTQISIAIPEGTYGRVAPRSGLALRFSLHVGAGVIDPNYCGTVCVLLFNLSTADFEVGVGDCIAQLVLERIATPTITKDPELEAYTLSSLDPSGNGSISGDNTTLVDSNRPLSPYRVTNPTTSSSLTWDRPPTSLLT